MPAGLGGILKTTITQHLSQKNGNLYFSLFIINFSFKKEQGQHQFAPTLTLHLLTLQS